MKTRKYEGYWNFGFRVSIRTLKLSVFELFSQIDVIYQNKIKIMQVHCFLYNRKDLSAFLPLFKNTAKFYGDSKHLYSYYLIF